MNSKNTDFAPYAGPSTMISLLRKFRDSGLPWPMTAESLTHVGISEGNAPRTLAAFKFLGLVDEDGQRTKLMDSLGKASTDEYPEVLAEVVRSAYSYVFSIHDPATANEIQIADAFRNYSPEKQRSRMVALFMGLCKESKITSGDPTIVERKSRVSRNLPSKAGQGVETTIQRTAPNMNFSLNRWAEKLKPVLEKLPDVDNPEWTEQERERWVHAMSAFLDLYIQVRKEQEELPF